MRGCEACFRHNDVIATRAMRHHQRPVGVIALVVVTAKVNARWCAVGARWQSRQIQAQAQVVGAACDNAQGDTNLAKLGPLTKSDIALDAGPARLEAMRQARPPVACDMGSLSKQCEQLTPALWLQISLQQQLLKTAGDVKCGLDDRLVSV